MCVNHGPQPLKGVAFIEAEMTNLTKLRRPTIICEGFLENFIVLCHHNFMSDLRAFPG